MEWLWISWGGSKQLIRDFIFQERLVKGHSCGVAFF
jgi:hypothetical protein